MRSLAVLGIDGTLKRRMKDTAVRGRGKFKTGTLRNVRGIAGFVRAQDGQTYIVSVLHNDPKARSRARKAHDEVIKWAFSGGSASQYAAR
jgi:D-alanyl-D-alanine carboxypeptidase/D-alanyl-D-alanine-endopeptidase (penicillin-binding protein 4)